MSEIGESGPGAGASDPAATTQDPRTPGARRPLLRRPLALTALGLLILAVAGAIYVGVTGARAYSAATALRAHLAAAESAAREVRLGDAAAEIPLARAAADDLLSATGGPVWAAIAATPRLGGNVAAARALAESVVAVADAAGPLLETARLASETGLRDDSGRIDLERLRAVPAHLEAVATATETATTRLAQIDTDTLIAPLADGLMQARAELTGLPASLRAAGTYVGRVPALLGADGPRTWLVMLQNVAEARGTGGLLGAYVLLRADDGRVEVIKADTNNSLQPYPIPQTGLPADFASLWGADATQWASFNLTLHFPYAAQLASNGMAERGTPIDGVIALDQRVVAALITATGPVSSDQVTIDGTSAYDYLTSGIYIDFPDPARKDAVTLDLLTATMERAIGGEVDLGALAGALPATVSQGRIRMWSAVDDEQEWIAESILGGVVPTVPGPFIGVAFNNGAGNKMDAFVRGEVSYAVGRCVDAPEQQSQVAVRLTLDAPPGLPDYVTLRLDDPAAEPNSTRMLVHVYGPKGAFVNDARVNGEPAPIFGGEERGRPVWGFEVPVLNGATSELVVDLIEPSRPNRPALVMVTPMAQEVPVSVTEISADCS